jgi:Chromosome segregation ATPases
MGSDAYSVIELKMIEQILSVTADDRKSMFEEAAGINKYKQQRQCALRKFDAIQRDLDGINDIVQEVEQQVHGLGLQLKRFNRHEKLSTSLFEKELALAYDKIHNSDSELIPLRKNVAESLALKNEKSSDSLLLEKELEEIKKTYVSQQEELQKMPINLQKLEKDRELAQNNVLIWNEQFKSAEININRLSNEFSLNQEKKISLLDKIAEYKKDIDQLSPSIKDQS